MNFTEKDPILSPEWVNEHLNDPKLRLVDCRFFSGEPERGKKEYEEGHLPGAVYVDLEKEMTGQKGLHGGRHPLPELAEFARLLGRLGILRDHIVVAYDDQWGEYAGRFWSLMVLLGHPEVYLLDGGLGEWIKRGYPLTAQLPEHPPVEYVSSGIHTDFIALMDEVKEKLGTKDTILIDSRERRRYLGEIEPLDPIAGHIPGAKNFYYQELIAPDGRWKSKAELKEFFSSLDPEKELIVYCGSGITACPNVIGLLRAGYRKVRLYAGSWSDWISYPDNPIARGDE